MTTRSKRRSLREQAMNGIVHHAKECEDAARLALFAESQSLFYLPEMPLSLRKLAAYHSEQAFGWAATMARVGGAA